MESANTTTPITTTTTTSLSSTTTNTSNSTGNNENTNILREPKRYKLKSKTEFISINQTKNPEDVNEYKLRNSIKMNQNNSDNDTNDIGSIGMSIQER
jgi:hypothetical protein